MLRDVLKNLTSDSVALTRASLGARLGPTLGAGLGAGSAGAGGAAAASPLQWGLHDGLCPPQIWVAAEAQTRTPSVSVTCSSGLQLLPTLTGRVGKVREHLLCWTRQG